MTFHAREHPCRRKAKAARSVCDRPTPRSRAVIWSTWGRVRCSSAAQQALALAAVRQPAAGALGAGRDHHDARLAPRPRVQGEPVLKLADPRDSDTGQDITPSASILARNRINRTTAGASSLVQSTDTGDDHNSLQAARSEAVSPSGGGGGVRGASEMVWPARPRR
jgi:hypothetical protein